MSPTNRPWDEMDKTGVKCTRLHLKQIYIGHELADWVVPSLPQGSIEAGVSFQ